MVEIPKNPVPTRNIRVRAPCVDVLKRRLSGGGLVITEVRSQQSTAFGGLWTVDQLGKPKQKLQLVRSCGTEQRPYHYSLP